MTVIYNDPFSSRSGFEYAMDRMQKEIDYKLKHLQDNMRMQQPQNAPIYQSVQMNGETQIYKNGVLQSDSKEIKEKASKLKSLIAYYYKR